MALNLKGRSLLTLKDYTPEEIRYILDLSHDLKSKKRAGINGDLLKGKHIVLLFEKTSTRTRCAFEVACADEGGRATFLDSKSSQMNIKESMEDSAKVLGRFFDGIEYRGYDQEIVECLAKHSGIPVWNGLTNMDHPTQILADLMTLEEHAKKPLDEIKVVFCGDIRNNMSYAWMYGCAKMGMHFVAYGPKELTVDEEVLATANEIAAQTGATIEISHTPDCLEGADAVYTDVWASMGEEALIPERAKMLAPYKVTMDMLKATGNPDILFMHCLPAYHDFETETAKKWIEKGIDIREVEDEVFRSRYSIVFAETENRMHTAKAILIATI